MQASGSFHSWWDGSSSGSMHSPSTRGTRALGSGARRLVPWVVGLCAVGLLLLWPVAKTHVVRRGDSFPEVCRLLGAETNDEKVEMLRQNPRLRPRSMQPGSRVIYRMTVYQHLIGLLAATSGRAAISRPVTAPPAIPRFDPDKGPPTAVVVLYAGSAVRPCPNPKIVTGQGAPVAENLFLANPEFLVYFEGTSIEPPPSIWTNPVVVEARSSDPEGCTFTVDERQAQALKDLDAEWRLFAKVPFVVKKQRRSRS